MPVADPDALGLLGVVPVALELSGIAVASNGDSAGVAPRDDLADPGVHDFDVVAGTGLPMLPGRTPNQSRQFLVGPVQNLGREGRPPEQMASTSRSRKV